MNSTHRHLITGNPNRAMTKVNPGINKKFSPTRSRDLVFLTQHIVTLSVIPITRRTFPFFSLSPLSPADDTAARKSENSGPNMVSAKKLCLVPAAAL